MRAAALLLRGNSPTAQLAEPPTSARASRKLQPITKEPQPNSAKKTLSVAVAAGGVAFYKWYQQES